MNHEQDRAERDAQIKREAKEIIENIRRTEKEQPSAQARRSDQLSMSIVVLIWVVIGVTVIGFALYLKDRHDTRNLRRFERSINDILGG